MMPKFLRSEYFPYESVESVPASAERLVARLTDSAPPRPVICAWCPTFDPTVDSARASHGMCQACSDKMIFEAMKRQQEREHDDEREELCGAECGANCGYCGRCS